VKGFPFASFHQTQSSIHPINVYTKIINVNTKIEKKGALPYKCMGFSLEMKNPTEYQQGLKSLSANDDEGAITKYASKNPQH
jgi:hypothetical protein